MRAAPRGRVQRVRRRRAVSRARAALRVAAGERAALHLLLRAVPVQAQELEVGHDRRVNWPRRDVHRRRRAFDSLCSALRRCEFE